MTNNEVSHERLSQGRPAKKHYTVSSACISASSSARMQMKIRIVTYIQLQASTYYPFFLLLLSKYLNQY